MKYGIGSTLCFSDEKCQSRREIHGHKLLCLGDFYVGVKLEFEEKKTQLISRSCLMGFSL